MKTFKFSEAFLRTAEGTEFRNDALKKEMFETLFDRDGYILISGFPIDASQIEKSEIDLLDFSFMFGVPVSQTVENDFICRVQDEKKTRNASVRGYQHSGRLPFHSDRCDLLMLCGVNPSPVGGETMVISGRKIQEEVSSRYPVAYERLKKPFPFEKRIGGFGDVQPWYTAPVFTDTDNRSVLWYCRGYIDDSQKHSECPRLDAEKVEALDVMCSVVNENGHIEKINLQRGDVLIMNSTATLHARNGFPAESDRMLLRVWISNNNCELPEQFKDVFGRVDKGSYRGGLWSDELNLTKISKDISQARKEIKNELLKRQSVV